jgi:hypothetical protein
VKRSLLLLATLPSTLALLATIGFAARAHAVPEGWSDPDPVSWTSALLVLVVAPALLFALIAGVTSLPHFVKRARDEAQPHTPADAPQLEASQIGASQIEPSSEVPELDAPDLQAPVPE